MRRRLAVALGSLLLFGCGSSDGDDDAVAGNFTGQWSGTAGGDSTYLDLTQTGNGVEGSACERPGMDCMTIMDGRTSGRVLTFSYSWLEPSDGETYTVTADIDLDAHGSALEGSYTRSKCSCSLDAR
jgi:hypothetical protein